jgi:hypothetical protein
MSIKQSYTTIGNVNDRCTGLLLYVWVVWICVIHMCLRTKILKHNSGYNIWDFSSRVLDHFIVSEILNSFNLSFVCPIFIVPTLLLHISDAAIAVSWQ